MARHPRLNLPGVPVHVIQRGNNRNACFFVDTDRELYLTLLGSAARQHDCAIHAYVLMPTHVHLLVTPAAGDGVAAMMQQLGRRYVRIFNDVHQRTGTLWEGRYKAAMIDSERYLLTCQRYVELNPVRAGLADSPSAFRWSSHRHYVHGFRNPLINAHEVFCSLAREDVARREAYLELFRQPMDRAEIERIRSATNKGWPLGSEEFIQRVEAALGRPAKAPKRGRPIQETDNGLQGQVEMLI
jgi:putative transposase